MWGFKAFGKIDTVQNRAMRIYLGVHNYAPNAAVSADVGWTPSHCRRKIEMLRLWNRLVIMENGRLTKQIFEWDYSINKNNWSQEIRKILEELELTCLFDEKETVSINNVWSLLYEKHCSKWSDSVVTFPKLRTYILFKTSYGVEPYVHKIMNSRYRSVLARFRCGILPLEIEIRRFQPLENMHREICKICKQHVLEDELHFLFNCDKYNLPRTVFLRYINENVRGFSEKTVEEKLQIIMQDEFVLETAKYLYDIFKIRQKLVYENVEM